MTGPAHAVYAPSSAHRWAAEGGCSASAEAIAKLGEQESNEAAEKGTAAHDEIERLLGHMNGRLVQPEEFDAVQVDPEHPSAYGIALVIRYMRGLPAGVVRIEQRVRLTDDIWGRCDISHWQIET